MLLIAEGVCSLDAGPVVPAAGLLVVAVKAPAYPARWRPHALAN